MAIRLLVAGQVTSGSNQISRYMVYDNQIHHAHTCPPNVGKCWYCSIASIYSKKMESTIYTFESFSKTFEFGGEYSNSFVCLPQNSLGFTVFFLSGLELELQRGERQPLEAYTALLEILRGACADEVAHKEDAAAGAAKELQGSGVSGIMDSLQFSAVYWASRVGAAIAKHV